MSMRSRLLMMLSLTVTAIALPASGASAAGVTTTTYKIIGDLPPGTTAVPADGPSTLQAGANPTGGSYSNFIYPNAIEDLKTTTTDFAPGLLGNPEATAKCPQADLVAPNYGTTCPPGSVLGTSRFDAQLAGSLPPPTIASDGIVYNAEPLGNEPGRLGVVTTPAVGPKIVSSIPFEITPRGNGDYGLTGTLTDVDRLDPPAFPAPLQAGALSFLVNASTKFVRNPTSCIPASSTGTAKGWDDPTVNTSPTYTFTPTGCNQVPFGPTMSVELGNAGGTATQRYPEVIVKVNNQNGNADIKGNTLLLPEELNTNNRAYKLCTQAQADSDTCPANSQFGSASATSPFLKEAVTGPVYLVQQTSASLPGLLIDLKGRAHVKIQTSTQLVNNKQIKSVVTNAPQLPVSQLQVNLNGGKDGGVFQNRSDLCFQTGSTSKFKDLKSSVSFDGWNGATTSTKIDNPTRGCGPGVSGKISGAQRNSPKLTVNAQKAPDAQKIKQLEIALPKGLAFNKKRLRRGASVNTSAKVRSKSLKISGRKLTIGGLSSAGVNAVNASLRKGLLKVSKSTKRRLNRGKRLTFKIKVTDTPISGTKLSTTATVKVKGKKKRKR